MSNKVFGQVVILIILIFGGVTGVAYVMKKPQQIGPDPVVVVAKPIVGSLSGCYHALADIIRRDSEGLISTTGQFYLAHIRALKLLVSETDYQRVAGRDTEISKTIEEAMGGLANQQITPELRVKLADTLDGIGDTL